MKLSARKEQLRDMKLAQLLPAYFGNYVRLVYLAQSRSPALLRRAREAAAYLGLSLEVRHTGYGDLRPALERQAAELVGGRG